MTSGPEAPLTEAEARRVRPFMSGVVALAVALVVAVGWYFVNRGDTSTRAQETQSPAEVATWVKGARADGKLVTFAPASFPRGWEVTSARYVTGIAAHWHLGLLTSGGKYVGVEESRDGTKELVEQFVDSDATQRDDVVVGGSTWKVFTDGGGDYALIRTVQSPEGEQERLLVVGSAPADEIRDFAASLTPDALPR